MPGIQDFTRVSLISVRPDIINLVEAMCADFLRLTIASDFHGLSNSDYSLLFVDASIFKDFDIDLLEYGKKYSALSICILPPALSPQVLTCVENIFKYFIPFPVSHDYFRSYCLRVKTVISSVSRSHISNKLQTQPIPESFSGYFCGDSKIIKVVRSQIISAACSKAPVLILGETGTGKTTAAQVIHTLSDRKNKKMISVSLSTIVESLAESSFFGHVRGSYTNADCERIGYFEVANGSTLFLDELGVASPSLQAMLLTVLDNGNYKKIGDNEERHSDVRMIFATNADLEKMLNTGLFRRDLYFRIFDNTIHIPPLKAHKEDIRGMVMHFLPDDTIISEDALCLLEEYSWPGNIRELHKCLKRACINCINKVITAESIDFGDISFPQ